MVAAFALFFAACLLAGRWTVMKRLPAWSAQAWTLSVALLAVFVGIAVWYVGLEGFASEVEPAVSTLSGSGTISAAVRPKRLSSSRARWNSSPVIVPPC